MDYNVINKNAIELLKCQNRKNYLYEPRAATGAASRIPAHPRSRSMVPCQIHSQISEYDIGRRPRAGNYGENELGTMAKKDGN